MRRRRKRIDLRGTEVLRLRAGDVLVYRLDEKHLPVARVKALYEQLRLVTEPLGATAVILAGGEFQVIRSDEVDLSGTKQATP